MKPTLDPLDELIAAALHGELTPQERTALEIRLQNEPAARAAYQESQLMHDLLEKTHREAQPDPAFEERIISGVRRRIQQKHRETAWESALVLWRAVRGVLGNRWVRGGALACLLVLLVGLGALDHFRHATLLTGMSDQDDTGIANPTRDFLKAYTSASPMQMEQAELADSQKKALFNHAAPAFTSRLPNAETASAVVAVNSVPGSPPITALTSIAPIAAPMAPTVTTAPALDDSLSTKMPTIYRAFNSVPDATSMAVAAQPMVPAPAPQPSAMSNSDLNRKLIRNAQLDLEVKNYQEAVDQITALTKASGGYVDTSNSQRGGNGKLQGTMVVKILPQNLDDFLLKLRGLGEMKNQAVSTDDVTKDYYDTQARLDNSRRMETQLQELLKRNNGKVADLLEVERELGRVRGEIEQMQGELKLYDFQVQYATVTLSVEEKDLNQAAAYLLQERDDFSLFANDVETTFQQARRAADDFKAQVLSANLMHNSGSDVSAVLVVSVPPDQIDDFLDRVRSLGRVENFTRQTSRVARDGGQTDQPADETKTEKDRVLVNLNIRSDSETRKQVALTVVTPAVDVALDRAKAAALASAGAEIMSSSLSKTPEGPASAQISVRVPGKNYPALLDAFRALGRTSSFSLQRDDNSGPNASGDDSPVMIALALTDDETPLQETELSVRSEDVDAKAQQLKKKAAAAGVEVRASSFDRQPDGTETARLTFRVPLGRYPEFLGQLENLGRVETLTVHREDQARGDESAPAEIRFLLQSQGEIVADDNGLWATLRRTFGEGAAALFGSVKTIGVMVAFLVPWVFVLAVGAWIARRIYVSRRK
jgi:hypothetical protein